MPVRFIITFTLIIGLAGCSTGWNPMNWFKSSRVETIALIPEGGFPEDFDGRGIVTSVASMEVLRAAGGAIIKATGLPPHQGYWDAELVPENDEYPVNGVLTYVFRISEPRNPAGSANAYARQVHVAHFISEVRLQDVRQIRVLGDENSRIARR